MATLTSGRSVVGELEDQRVLPRPEDPGSTFVAYSVMGRIQLFAAANVPAVVVVKEPVPFGMRPYVVLA